MSTKFITDHIRTDNLESILHIKLCTLSERIIPSIQIQIPRKVYSDIHIETNVNYDDICGAWIHPKNPVYDQYVTPLLPSVCIWKYFTEKHIIYLKKCQRNEGLSLFGKVFLYQYKGKSNHIFAKVLWEFLKFVRFYSFTEKAVSIILGVVHLTHLFFLSNPRCTAEEVFQYFRDNILVHAVLNPPNSIEAFSIVECKRVLKIFNEVFLENLVLLHILCHEIYYFTINLDNSLSWIQENQL